jgi:hypothetical protein
MPAVDADIPGLQIFFTAPGVARFVEHLRNISTALGLYKSECRFSNDY